ncbi:MAG: hypothetical protein WAW85_05625, partial [Gordonia sp. (in: high G+C Gram-positive bacteria)]|uniref:hypothetical protein n=1 Tax=Gordonia sp. (in: high G+C Gram-positive bacteria) TaxID=84139 RepID=UPI003BB5E6F0
MTSGVRMDGALRRRGVLGLAGVGMSAALLLGTAAPALAATESPQPGVQASSRLVAQCDAGSGTSEAGDNGGGAATGRYHLNCFDSSPSLLAAGLDGLLGLFSTEPVSVFTGLNQAVAIRVPFTSTSATIAGNGLAGAYAGAGASAAARAGQVFSIAIAGGAFGGTANSHANLFGLAAAIASGSSAVANARALPGGIAIVYAPGAGQTGSATAFGGLATATATGGDDAYVTCSAVYATSSITTGTGAAKRNVRSCTSVLFLLQRSQEGDGPVVYALMNPLSLRLASPLGDPSRLDGLIGVIERVAPILGISVPDNLADTLGTRFIPHMRSDIVRVSVGADGWKIGSGVVDWARDQIGGARESTSTPQVVDSEQVVPQAESLNSIQQLDTGAASP